MNTNFLFKAIIICTIFLSGTFIAEAQTGIHVQEYITDAYVYNEDSVYINASFSTGYSHIALVNPVTKEWKYQNSVSYGKHVGPFVMKNGLEGVMIYSSQQKVYRTTDGWQTITDVGSVADGFGISQIEVTNAGYLGYESARRDIYFSPDGITWNLVFDAGSGTNVLRAKGNKVIFLTGASSNQVSTDGGQTFSSISFGSLGFTGDFIDFVMVSEEMFILASTTALYKTFDGGTTWIEKPLPTSSEFTFITVKDSVEIFAGIRNTGVTQHIYTSDGGDTWEVKTDPNTVGLAAGGKGSYIGNNLYLLPNYKSPDNGTTWELFLPQTVSNGSILDLSFNGNLGFGGRAGGQILLSVDKGRSFGFNIKLPTSEDIMAVKVLSNNDFIAGDRNGQVFYSKDKGSSWTHIYSNNLPYNAVKFSSSDDDNIIVVTRYGQPLVSTDHGTSFEILNVGGGSHSQTVKPNGEIIDAVGWFDYTTFQNKGWEISRWTPTGSKTIIDTFLVADETLADIHMANNNVGYLFTYNNTSKVTRVYKTTNGWNGGTELISTIDPVNPAIANYRAGANIKIHSFGSDSLILVGNGNTYYHYSYDGGVTWGKAELPIHSIYPTLYPSLKKSHFFSTSEFIFSLNNQGLYLNVHSSGGGTTGIKEITENGKNALPDNYLLYQNYPNPFNPLTSIKFSIPEGGVVSLKIFNTLGEEVAELFNKDFSAGNYEYEWNAGNLPSGIYFYSLTANGFSAVKKMIFLK